MDQTVASCARATNMAVVMTSLVSAPVTPVAGVHCARTPASVAMENAIPSMETAPVIRAIGRQSAPSSATAWARWAQWVPSATR